MRARWRGLRQRLLATAGAFVFSLVSASTGPALAQSDFPNRRIDLVVPLPPGGPNDSAVRLLAAHMGPLLNVPLVTLNKPGAGGAIAAAAVATAKPDGYTVLATSNSVLSINVALQKDLAYQLSDFTPIGMFAADIGAIVSRRDQPWTNLEEFVSYARAHRNTLSYGSAGIGTVSHFSAELFKLSYGIDVVHVPYQGTGPAKAAILAGHVPLASAGFAAFADQVRAGDVIALAATAPKRLAAFPTVPTFAEKGFPEATLNIWIGLYVPAKTPPDAVVALSGALAKAAQDPAFVSAIEKAEMIVDYRDGPATLRQLETEYALAQKVIPRIDLKN